MYTAGISLIRVHVHEVMFLVDNYSLGVILWGWGNFRDIPEVRNYVFDQPYECLFKFSLA